MKSSTLLIFCVCILIVAPLAAQNAVNPDEQKCLDLSGDEAISSLHAGDRLAYAAHVKSGQYLLQPRLRVQEQEPVRPCDCRL